MSDPPRKPQPIPQADGAESLPQPAPSEGRRDREQWMRHQLRRIYDDVVNEPLPDDLQSLIDQLDDSPTDR